MFYIHCNNFVDCTFSLWLVQLLHKLIGGTKHLYHVSYHITKLFTTNHELCRKFDHFDPFKSSQTNFAFYASLSVSSIIIEWKQSNLHTSAISYFQHFFG
jgi:hypothetical protein